MRKNFYWAPMIWDELPKLLWILVVFVVWFIAAMWLSGCAGKGLKLEVHTTGPNNETKDVKVETDYQVENGFNLKRNTETGDYEIDLGSATTKDADPGMWMFMNTMLQMMQSVIMPGGPIPVPPNPAGEDNE